MPDAMPPNPMLPMHLSDPDVREAGEIRLREDRDAGAVLSAALRLGVAEARGLGAAVLAIAGPLVLAAALARLVGADAGAAVGSFLDLAASVLLSATVFGYVRLYMAGAPSGVADVWEAAKPLVWPVFAFSAVGVFALALLAIPLVIVGSALYAASPALTAVLGVAAFVAFFLSAVPVFALGSVAVALDAMTTGEAFARAAGLVRDQWPRVAAATVLVMLLAGFVVLLVVGALAGTVGAENVEAMSGPTVLGAIGGAAVTLALLPVNVGFTLAWAVLYGSLVERAEGVSMGGDLDALAAGDAAPDGTAPSGNAPLGDAPGRAATDARPPDSRGGGFRGGGYVEPETPARPDETP